MIAYIAIAGFLLIYLVIKKPQFLFNPSDYDAAVQPLLFGNQADILDVQVPNQDVNEEA